MKPAAIPAQVTVREMTASDIGQVLRLEQEVESAPHWSRAAYEACGGDQTGSLRNFGLVAECGGELAGFAVVRHLVVEARGPLAAESECELESIVVASRYRRRGVGSHLMSAVFAAARLRRASSLTLEVRESNHAALALYLGCGFQIDGRRPEYYIDPAEDAVLMSITLTDNN